MANEAEQYCPRCSKVVTSIAIKVDGRDLVMHSCVTCDSRSWSLAGQSIELAIALEEVGQHAGRQR